MPGFVSVPVTSPSGAGRAGAMARIGARGSVAGSAPSKMIRSHGRPSVRSLAGPYSRGGHAEQLDVREVAQRRLEVRVARPDEQDQARPVGRDDRPGAVVDGQLVRRAP